MKIIRDRAKIQEAAAFCELPAHSEKTEFDFFLVEYKKGEFLRTPDKNTDWIQIVVSGVVNIYYIAEDGTVNALGYGSGHSHIGEMETFLDSGFSIFTEACSDVRTLAFSVSAHRTALMNDPVFLETVIRGLAATLSASITGSMADQPLKDRLLNHMKYRCENQTLKGIEQHAVLMHCSPRHLQRVLNELEAEQAVEKIGKGCYRLLN